MMNRVAPRRTMMLVMILLMTGTVADSVGNQSELTHRTRRYSKKKVIVCVKTNGDDNYGIKDEQNTDENVYIQFAGRDRYSHWFDLDTSKNDFEVGNLDCFDLYIGYIGPQLLRIGMRTTISYSNSHWLLDYVAVQYNGRCKVFQYSTWIYTTTSRYKYPSYNCGKAGSSSVTVNAMTLCLGIFITTAVTSVQLRE